MPRRVSPTQQTEPYSDGVPPEETAFSITLAPGGGLNWDHYKRLYVEGGGGGIPDLDAVTDAGNTTDNGIVLNSDGPTALTVNSTATTSSMPIQLFAVTTLEGELVEEPPLNEDAQGTQVFGVDRFGGIQGASVYLNKQVRIGGSDAVATDANPRYQLRDMADPSSNQYGLADGVSIVSAGGRLRVYNTNGSDGHPITDLVQLYPSTDAGNALTLGTDKGLHVAAATAQADSTATDVAGLVADFNTLLASLRTAGLLAT